MTSPPSGARSRNVFAAKTLAGVLMCVSFTFACTPSGSQSNQSAEASQQQPERVSDVWARVQATMYDGCGKSDCSDYLERVLTELQSLRLSMGSQGDRFERPIEVIDKVEETVHANGDDDLNASKDSILQAPRDLQEWMARHPESLQG